MQLYQETTVFVEEKTIMNLLLTAHLQKICTEIEYLVNVSFVSIDVPKSIINTK